VRSLSTTKKEGRIAPSFTWSKRKRGTASPVRRQKKKKEMRLAILVTNEKREVLCNPVAGKKGFSFSLKREKRRGIASGGLLSDGKQKGKGRSVEGRVVLELLEKKKGRH